MFYRRIIRMRAVLSVALVGLVVCVGCGPSQEEEAIAAIKALRGKFEVDENKAIVMVDLRGTKATDAGLVHLKGLTKLEGLLLAGSKITDAGMAHLKGLTKLEGLDLKGTKVTDAGLAHLKGLRNLGYLVLRNTYVTAAGIKKLQQALPHCKIWH